MSFGGFSFTTRSVYVLLRLAAYGFGVAGAILVYLGQRMEDAATGGILFRIGWGLLILTFVLFAVSYVYFVILKFFRPRRKPDLPDGP